MDDKRRGERFALGPELGRGRRSLVLAATDTLLGREVALKRTQATSDAPLLLEEARRLARIVDPHVVALHDVLAGPPLTLVLQRLIGRTLRAALSESGRLPLERARGLGADLLAALQAVHAAGVVHGDVKPENLWVTPEGRLLLLDLGALGDVTALYQAPETATGEPDRAADLYSAGVVIFEMLAGRPPFDATDALELATRKLTQAPHRVTSFGAVVPEAVESWLERALAADPRARWSDAAAALGAWHEAVAAPAEARPTLDRGFQLYPEVWSQLQELLPPLDAGAGVVRVLSGPAGVGKSTLAASWCATAASRGVRALLVRPALAEQPFGAWLAALGALPAGSRRSLRALAPRALRSSDSKSSLHDAQRIADRLLQTAQDQACALVFDGWPECDPATRELSLQLAERVTAGRVAVLFVIDDPAPEARWAGSALARPGWLRFHLELPPRERWTEFVAQLLATANPSPTLCDHLWSRTGGDPLLTTLLLDALRADETLRFDQDAWIFRPERLGARLPPAVRDLLADRWEAVPRERRDLLSLAAVQGPRFDPVILAARLGRSAASVGEELHALAATHGIVRPSGAAFDFDPPLWADLLLEQLGPERRRDEHARLAATLQAIPSPDDAALGLHLARAGFTEKALPYLERAALAALERADYAVALAQAEDALAASSPAPSDEGAARQRATLSHLRARALQGLASWDAADAELEGAVVLARAWGQDDIEMRALGSRGQIDYARGRFEEAIEHFLEAQLAAARLGEEKELHELGIKVGNIHFERGDLAAALTEYDRALAHATAGGDLDLEARAANNVALVHSLQGRKELAVQFFDRSLQRFRALGRDDAVAQLDQNIGQIYLELGNWAEARNSFERCMRQCEKTGQDALLAIACLDAAEANLKLGALPEAGRAAERALALARERDDAVGIANAMRVQASLAAAGGDLAAAESRLLEAIHRLERLGQPLHLGMCWKDLGSVRLGAGRRAAAAQALEKARTLFASLDAAQHASETAALRAECGEVESCNLP